MLKNNMLIIICLLLNITFTLSDEINIKDLSVSEKCEDITANQSELPDNFLILDEGQAPVLQPEPLPNPQKGAVVYNAGLILKNHTPSTPAEDVKLALKIPGGLFGGENINQLSLIFGILGQISQTLILGDLNSNEWSEHIIFNGFTLGPGELLDVSALVESRKNNAMKWLKNSISLTDVNRNDIPTLIYGGSITIAKGSKSNNETPLISSKPYNASIQHRLTGMPGNFKYPNECNLEIPDNDLCQNCAVIQGSGVRDGTCIEATEDCPEIDNYKCVWYCIDAPYTSNFIEIDFCRTWTELGDDIWTIWPVIFKSCSCDSSEIILADFFIWNEELSCNFQPLYRFNYLPGPATYYLPVYALNTADLPIAFRFEYSIRDADNVLNYIFGNNSNCTIKIDQISIGWYPELIEPDSMYSYHMFNDLNVYANGGAGWLLEEDAEIDFVVPFDLPAGTFFIADILGTDSTGADSFHFIQQHEDETFYEPSGACCMSDGLCQDLIISQCDSIGGNYMGAWSYCDTVACEIPAIYEYYPGDANMAAGLWPPTAVGGDVTYLVNYFRGMVSPCILDGFYAAADINASCSITGADVTRLVNYFRGTNSIDYCPDYEPAWHTPADFPTSEPGGWPNCE